MDNTFCCWRPALRRGFVVVGLAIVMSLGVLPALGQAAVKAVIDSTVIFIGEQAHISLSVTAPKEARVTFPVYPDHLITPGLEVIKEEVVALDKDEETGRNTTTKRYTITSFDSALYYIPPFQVKVEDKVYESSSLALKVETMPIDTLHLDQYYGPKENADVPFSWVDDARGMFMASLVLVLLVLTIAYLLIQIHNRRPLLRLFRIKPPLPPHIWATQEIDKIKQNPQAAPDAKTYYTQLTDILRHYIWRRYDFNAREMTSGEIIERLMKQNDRAMIEELRALFEVADLAKFAKLQTQIGENDANLLKAVAYVQATKDETTPTEQPKMPLPPETRRSRRTSMVLRLVVGLLVVVVLALMVYIVHALYPLFL